jgi:uncharacterized tellurite resistance protein B-like protein
MNETTGQPRFEGTRLVLGAQDTPETYDARYLISTLLVYVAKSDGHISTSESNRMIDLLSAQLKIRGAEALQRLTSAIMALSNDSDIAARLEEIGRGLSAEEKSEVLGMMMEVISVDEDRQSSEIDAITRAGQILGLSLDAVVRYPRRITQYPAIAGNVAGFTASLSPFPAPRFHLVGNPVP